MTLQPRCQDGLRIITAILSYLWTLHVKPDMLRGVAAFDGNVWCCALMEIELKR
jgi:hypothetical protein